MLIIWCQHVRDDVLKKQSVHMDGRGPLHKFIKEKLVDMTSIDSTAGHKYFRLATLFSAEEWN